MSLIKNDTYRVKVFKYILACFINNIYIMVVILVSTKHDVRNQSVNWCIILWKIILIVMYHTNLKT